jgi:hypothetical protein
MAVRGAAIHVCPMPAPKDTDGTATPCHDAEHEVDDNQRRPELNTMSVSRRWFLACMLGGPICLMAKRFAFGEGSTSMASKPTGFSFRRSGGLIHLVLSGEVKLTEPDAGVRTEATGGTRPLTPREQTLFASLQADRLKASRLARGSQNSPFGMPEGYQYDVDVHFDDGQSVALVCHETPGQPPDTGDPAITALMTWVAAETDAIWRHRARQ